VAFSRIGIIGIGARWPGKRADRATDESSRFRVRSASLRAKSSWVKSLPRNS